MANPNSPDQPEWDSLFGPSCYYFFRVENQLFCVPDRCILFKGSFFERSLLVEALNPNVIPGYSKELPLVINGVSVDAFREFLRVVYPHADVDPPSSPEEWLRVLEVATELKVSKIREQAIIALNTHIENASFHERVVHGSRYGVADWLRQGLRGVVTSDPHQQVPHTKMIQLGIPFEILIRLLSHRERFLIGHIPDPAPVLRSQSPPACCVSCKELIGDPGHIRWAYKQLDVEFANEFLGVNIWDVDKYCSEECSKGEAA